MIAFLFLKMGRTWKIEGVLNRIRQEKSTDSDCTAFLHYLATKPDPERNIGQSRTVAEGGFNRPRVNAPSPTI